MTPSSSTKSEPSGEKRRGSATVSYPGYGEVCTVPIVPTPMLMALNCVLFAMLKTRPVASSQFAK